MRKSVILGGLLVSAAFVAPPAWAQAPDATPQETPPADDAPADEAQLAQETPPDEQEVEVSVPGADLPEEPDIVITGSRSRNIVRRAPEVVSVLSAEDIERTGDGDIAGALARVTGLSVVGNGFVFVRGLGDRYSLALLNGSPLPSPEPLRRVVPLDIFPTSVIASSLVQKSYSVNYPGEFGGGVINLTTPTAPRDPFFEIEASVGFDTETTFQLGYSYFGSDIDWTGFDDGTRDFPPALQEVMETGTFDQTSSAQRQDFAASLINAPTTLLQAMQETPANFSGEITAGTSFDLGGTRIGVFATAGYSNTWRSRDAIQQTSLDPLLGGTPQTSFESVTTDNRIIVNGLVGIAANFGEHQVRWTNLYIRDTLKQGRLAAGFNRSVSDQDPDLPPSIIEQNTYWFERQLIDTQLVGEFDFGNFDVDVRASYANTQRESPYERAFSYFFLGDGDPATKGPGDVDDYVNNLASGGQTATIAFSDLNEDVYAASADLAYRIPIDMPLTFSGGYSYTKVERTSSRFQFQYFRPDGALPIEVAQERPDFLVSDFNVFFYDIELRDISGAEGTAAYDASLEIHAGYGQAEIEPVDGVRLVGGVRYEDASQTVQPVGTTLSPTHLDNNYWLPAATLTWNIRDDLQLRLHGSRTIARPQFRELAPQIYQDFESDREYTGNPFLVDSELTNAEARLEWYFLPDQRITAAGFYKNIDNPIESAAFIAGGGQLRTGFANAPSAELYGAEFEIQTYLPLDGMDGSFWATRRLLLAANYTYSQSSVTSDDSLIIGPDLQPVAANLLFEDGAPLTGQSDHLVNLQFGIEDTDSLSQATFLVSFASERVVDRGPIQGTLRQPDILEDPGLRLDFVLRQEARLFNTRLEFNFEIRNITGENYEEFQEVDGTRIETNTYPTGRIFSLGVKAEF